MSIMRRGYGSEWHLRMYLTEHRQHLDAAVMSQTGAVGVEWLGFFSNASDVPGSEKRYEEIKGLDFLARDHSARAAWGQWWPQTGNVQNWDAVAKLDFGGHEEWLLVEAKANLKELESACGASPAAQGGGLDMILTRLQEVQQSCGIATTKDWLRPYYQYANRLSVVHFLAQQQIPARMLFIYFTGDKGDAARICPADQHQWKPALERMKATLGLLGESTLESRVHELFLPVRNFAGDK